MALLFGKLPDGVEHFTTPPVLGSLLVNNETVIHRTFEEIVDRIEHLAAATAAPELIDDSMARDRHDPGSAGTPCGFELRRSLPDAHEDVLDDLLGGSAPQRVCRYRIDVSCVAVVQCTECSEVAAG